ncbi:MAG: CoA pyrophosphatase [Proteobacteria bacterium]|nr:CoA pyrophosphatase [Pseudomonadota bacterium]
MSSLSSLPDFDPRAVPLVGVDVGLPVVPAAAQTPDALRQRFAAPPPWTPEIVRERKFVERATVHAAVLMPIVQRDRPTVLLTERTANLSTHKGQVAFPGGRTDPEDSDAAATALREAHEEVGLEAASVEVLGSLPIYVTGSSFIVTPVVALVKPDFALQPNPHEVADVFEVPLDFLLNPAHHERHALEWQGLRREWFAMPYQDGERQRYIWGATAAMLRNFYRFMLAS